MKGALVIEPEDPLLIALAKFFESRGHVRLCDKPVVSETIPGSDGGEWTLRCNGADHEREGVPPFCFAVEWGDWPAGHIYADGNGFLCAGSRANEESLRAALVMAVQGAGTGTDEGA